MNALRTNASRRAFAKLFKTSKANRRCFSAASSKEPRCSLALGQALPTDEHACSVSLPTWNSVVGYEEGDSNVIQKLSTGYPRFVYHPYIVQLMERIVKLYGDSQTQDCLVLPTRAAAERCRAFLQHGLERNETMDNADIHAALPESSVSSSPCSIVELQHVSAVLFPTETKYAVAAKAYWQHTGEIVSSRRAEMALSELQQPITKFVTDCRSAHHPSKANDEARCDGLLRERIAHWTACVDASHVWLAPSGMGGIYAALRAARRIQRQNATVAGTSMVFGFPYLDTLKLCSRTEVCPDGVEFFGHGDAKDLEQLERLLEQRRSKYCALFTEIPSNPLLQSPDLKALRRLADKYGFYLIVDDTIGNFLNVDVLSNGIADAVCTSLTKLVSGRGDAIAGSIVTNPFTERGRALQEDFQKYHDPSALYESDAKAIYQNSTDFAERNAKINETSERFAQWLEDSQPDVAKVYYPKESANYAAVMREGAGFGGLVSILLHPHVCQRTFFDALDVPKGPSLGTNFTLVCPYTLLAHYHELDFAMSYDVPPNLLRIAVGLEPFDELRDKFETAFKSSRLYPKLSRPQAETLPQ